MVGRSGVEQKLGSPITYESSAWVGTVKALIGQIAAERFPGITATIKGKGRGIRSGGTHVKIRATAEGEQWLSRLSDHPLVKAARLLGDAAHGEIVAAWEENHARYVAPKAGHASLVASIRGLRETAQECRQQAIKLLAAQGRPQIPNSDLPSPQDLIEEAAVQLLQSQVSVTPISR